MEGYYGGDLMAGIDEHTLLLLHGENLEDSSQYHVTITNTGTTVSAAKSRFGGASLYFNGQSRLNAPAIDFGSSDFTVDWWENCDAMTGSSGSRFSDAFVTNSKYGNLLIGWKNMLFMSSNFTSWNIIQGGAVMDSTVGEWVHWAFVRHGTEFKSYKNGKLFYSATITEPIAYSPQSQLAIGQWKQSNPDAFKGHIDEFRISNIARWTADFTPPDQPYSTDAPETPSDFKCIVSNNKTATLTWKAVSGATGYRLYRDNKLLVDTTSTLFVDKILPLVEYTYSIVAYSEKGSSNPAYVTARLIVDATDLPLVFDRTQEDGNRVAQLIRIGYTKLTEEQKAEWDSCSSRGSWNFTDLNRVELWITYITTVLKSAGIDVSDITVFKANWNSNSNLYVEDVTHVQEEIEKLRNKLAQWEFNWATLVRGPSWSYEQANALEQDLQFMYDVIPSAFIWPTCGDSVCGGDYA